LRELGHDPLVDPVLEVRRLSPEIRFDEVAALAFTSRNGVESFAALSAERGLPVFAVGDATAEAAQRAGFAEVSSASGDVEALAELIAAAKLRGPVLNPTAREPAEDLAALLAARGVAARAAAVYETVARRSEAALEALPTLEVVLVHSPKAARLIAALVEPASAPNLVFACISAKAAQPLRDAGHEKVLAAQFPEEAGLLKLLDYR
jgi:uroporphyrinogen-III synthase